MNHRSFISLFPPEDVVQELVNVQHSLKHASQNVRWENSEKFHFTLQFFGDQSEEWIREIHNHISTILAGINPFPVSVTKLGYFPNRYSPKIFWAGSSREENNELVSLAEQIHEITRQNGLEGDKKIFYPHITIGRGKGKINRDLTQKIETITFHPIEFTCARLHIIKSSLAESGSTYTTLFTIPLKP